MCLAIPGQVKAIDGLRATIHYPGQDRPAMVGEQGIEVGDYVMVQMGIIIKKLNPEEAQQSLAAWQGQ